MSNVMDLPRDVRSRDRDAEDAVHQGRAVLELLAVGHVMLATIEYEAQQKHLQKELREEIFVATYKGMRTDGGRVFSYTTWSQGVPSLLPKADQVALVIGAGTASTAVMRVDWQLLLDVVGDCLQPEPDLLPPRWRTTRWPDGAALAKLAASAVAGN